MKDKPGLIITGKPKPLPNYEPPRKERILWMRWYMATTGASLKEAFHALNPWLKEHI